MLEPVVSENNEDIQQQFITELLASKPQLATLPNSEQRSLNELVRKMLDKKIDPDESDKAGNTALHIASQNLDLPTIRILLQNGADPGIKNSHNKTPLDFIKEAANSAEKDRASYLLEHLTPSKQGTMMATQAYIKQREKEGGAFNDISQLDNPNAEELAAASALLDSFEGIPLPEKHQALLGNGRFTAVYEQFQQAMQKKPLAGANNVDPKISAELNTLISSKVLIDPGVQLNRQQYPYLMALRKELSAETPNFVTIQRIAAKGYAANYVSKALYSKLDHQPVNNRLSLFLAILEANTLEQALVNVKERVPGLQGTQPGASSAS